MRTARARRPRRCTAPAIRASWHTPALNSSCKKSFAPWGGNDIPLPSVGAEGDMVRRIADLAGTGHHGVLICMADKDTPERVVAAIAPEGAAAAFYYRTFIIEDLVPQAPEQESQTVVVGTHAGPV